MMLPLIRELYGGERRMRTDSSPLEMGICGPVRSNANGAGVPI